MSVIEIYSYLTLTILLTIEIHNKFNFNRISTLTVAVYINY